MMVRKESIHYFTNIAPHYRQRLWEVMVNDPEINIEFYFARPSNSGIKEMNFETEIWRAYDNRLHRISNIRFFERIIWQTGVLTKAVSGNIKKALFLGDMNLLSTWLASIILQFRGAEIYFWGHGFKGDENFLKKKLRILFNRLADHHFIYGHRAKSLMVDYGFNSDNLHVVYNSLDYDMHVKLRDVNFEYQDLDALFDNTELPLLIFIGRLTAVKRLDILIRAVGKLNEEHPNYNLLIIGDGEIRDELTRLAKSKLSDGCYHFYGACYDEKKIGQLLSYADLCVSPGNVGLTAIHSLSFGTPVCTHDNLDNQMPEVEAIRPGVTGCFFEEGDAEDLSRQIKQWFSKEVSEEEIRKKCYEVIDTKYNPYNQLRIFKKVLIDEKSEEIKQKVNE